MELSNSSDELLINSNITENIDTGASDLKEKVKLDFLDTQRRTNEMVDQTAANIANWVPFHKAQSAAVSSSTSFKRDLDDIRTETEQLVEKNINEFKEKVKTDLKVIQLFDKTSTSELKSLVKKDIVEQSIDIVKNRTTTDFQKIQEDTNDSVITAKSTVKNYIKTLTNDSLSQQKEIDIPDENDILDKVKEKTQEDFEKLNNKSKKNVDKTKLRVRENMNVFLTNPTGTKTKEELESEEIMKEKLLEFEEMVKEDLEIEKVNTNQTVEETKKKISNRIKDIEIDEESIKTVEDKLLQLHGKTRSDFKEINAKLQDEVVNVKQKIDMPNVPESNEGDKSIKNMLDIVQNTIKADFKETNAKINKNIKDLSSTVAQSIILKENPGSSDNSGEVNHVVENSLNNFQNDFKEADKKIKDNVLDAKSKIDDSVNTLKGKLFKN